MALVSDATQTETHITLMTRLRAFIIFVIFVIFTIIFAVISFTVPNTRIEKNLRSSPSVGYTNTLSIREEYNDISTYSNFLHFEAIPAFARPNDERIVDITVSGGFYILDDKHNSAGFVNLSKKVNYRITKEKKPFNIIDINETYFNSIIAFIDLKVTRKEMRECEIRMTSLEDDVSIASLALSSILALSVAIMLVVINSRRVRPSAIDHWMTIFLAGALFFLDGPWQVFQYYAFSHFSVVYDLIPQLFHGFFIVYVFVFFGARSEGNAKTLFSSLFLHSATIIYAIVLAALELTITHGRQLVLFPVTEKNQALYIILCILFFTFHLLTIAAFIFGFTSIKVERTWSLILVVALFLSLEIINLAVFITRMFVSADSVGASAAADLFYILEANLVTFILIYINTPIAMSGDQGVTDDLLTDDDEIADV